MLSNRFQYRALMRCGLVSAVVAFPLFAYANMNSTPIVNDPSPVAAPLASVAAAAISPCDSENWPNLSQACVRGQSGLIKVRQIALVTNDTPLSPLPRVIDTPITQQHVVTVDQQKTSIHGPARRQVAERKVVSRRTAAIRTEQHLAELPNSNINLPAGW